MRVIIIIPINISGLGWFLADATNQAKQYENYAYLEAMWLLNFPIYFVSVAIEGCLCPACRLPIRDYN